MKRMLATALAVILLLGALGGCKDSDSPLDRKNPQALTFCHSYSGQLKVALDGLIAEFNDSYGKKNGIRVRAIAVDAASRDELLYQVIAGGEGAPAMPDLVAVSSAMAPRLLEAGRIAPMDEHLGETAMADYDPALSVSLLEADGRYLFPLAQTTDVLYVNKNLFDAFAEESGIALESLSTLDGISAAADAYFLWTDMQTPDVVGDGSAFFATDSWLRLAATGAAQTGGNLLLTDSAELATNEFQYFWRHAVLPGLSGSYVAPDERSYQLYAREEIVCYIGPASDITLYSNYQLATLSILPYPVVAEGNKVAPQVGDSVAIAASTAEKQYAAAQFLLWLTEAKHNTQLVTGTGYLPVNAKALEEYAKQVPKGVSDETVQALLETVATMYSEYEWLALPVGNLSSAALADNLENGLRWMIQDGRRQVLAGSPVPELNTVLLEGFIASGGDVSPLIAAGPTKIPEAPPEDSAPAAETSPAEGADPENPETAEGADSENPETAEGDVPPEQVAGEPPAAEQPAAEVSAVPAVPAVP